MHQIGNGVLGPVFRTYEPERDRLVAVKVFRLDITPEQAQALADELGRAAGANLFHQSIVEPLAAGVEGTVAYRAEEYVAAESLDIAVRHYAPATLERALPFITQLGEAIDFARKAGIGHGALHLRDVFMTPDEARAGGFGVVEALERVGLRAPVRRPYSAPERIAGARWSTPADVFSLGVIAYELLTGRRPSGVGQQIGPLSADTLGPAAEAVRDVLARGMAESPDDRYGTAMAFVSALEAASRQRSAELPIAERPPIAAIAMAAPEPIARVALEHEPVAMSRDDAPDDDVDLFLNPDEPGPAEDRAELPEERIEAHTGGTHREDAALFDDDEAHEQDEGLVQFVPEERFSQAFDLHDATDQAPERHPAPAPYEPHAVAHDDASFRDLPEREAIEAAAYEPRLALETPPTRALPLAMTLILGLVLGFGAGYAVGGRATPRADVGAAADVARTTATPVPIEPPPPTTEKPAAATPAGKAWSEQTVAPRPTAPPPVPNEAPEPARSPRTQPVATMGRIVVQSTPPRAGVTINDKWSGRTPLTIDPAKFGKYTVRVVEPGYTVSREQFTLSAAEPARTLSFRLSRVPGSAPRPAPATPAATAPSAPAATTGTVYVDSLPRGARVFVDGKEMGATPLRVPEVAVGTHVIRLELTGHRIWSVSRDVTAGQETRVTGSLDPLQ